MCNLKILKNISKRHCYFCVILQGAKTDIVLEHPHLKESSLPDLVTLNTENVIWRKLCCILCQWGKFDNACENFGEDIEQFLTGEWNEVSVVKQVKNGNNATPDFDTHLTQYSNVNVDWWDISTYKHILALTVIRYLRNMVIYHYPLVGVIYMVILHVFIIKNHPNFVLKLLP